MNGGALPGARRPRSVVPILRELRCVKQRPESQLLNRNI